jgi:cytosine/adenosine deaminase-related metal-dependent hydrolase
LSILFEQAIAFPGLINSHDHLDFNLFPQFGNRIYNNYVEWGLYINERHKDEIDMVLKIPRSLRVKWGLYKNLLNGITTVINHGELLPVNEDLINIYQRCYSIHSLRFEKYWKFKINNPFKRDWPFVIHTGEGIDEASSKEADEIIKWNIFKRKIIGVHGVSMNTKQAASFHALIWCPASNYFLLNRTASVEFLKYHTRILFGTDSCLTAGWNLWEHLRLARNEKKLTDLELFDSLTTLPAAVWHLMDIGKICEGQKADIIIARKKKEREWDAFYALNTEDILLVLHNGNIRLLDEELYSILKHSDYVLNGFTKIVIQDRIKYVYGDLPALIREVWKFYPEAKFPVSVN